MDRTSGTQITRRVDGDVVGVTLQRPGCTETFLTVPMREGEDDAAFAPRLLEWIESLPGQIAAVQLFGLTNGGADVLPTDEWPLTWLACTGRGGAYIQAVDGDDPRALFYHGRKIGMTYADAAARYCRLAGVLPDDVSLSRQQQAKQVFTDLRDALAQAGMTFADVIRTWFFNNDILAWYGGFNRVRTDYYNEHKVFDGLLPASTGIGAANEAGAALDAGLLAMQATGGGVRAFEVPSPLQGSACDYGSSFSRAAEIQTPDFRLLLVSGTASIDPEGHTVHIGDVDAQIDLTMRVVGAILESRAMGWLDVSRATAYLRHADDLPRYIAYCERENLPTLPAIVTCQTVCRDDLLFEIEVDALVGQ
jgi:enamine deaminase RidA (YjgF/YER057c/UK114 family)